MARRRAAGLLLLLALALVVVVVGFQTRIAPHSRASCGRLTGIRRSVTPSPSVADVQQAPPAAPTTSTPPAPQPVARPKQPGPEEQEDWRQLGSFETLLARKAAKGPRRLSIPHACVALVRGPPLDEPALRAALAGLVRRHPLLRARIKGDGKVEEPPVAGVRMGAKEPDPLCWAPCALTDTAVVDRALTVEKASTVGEDGSSDSSNAWYAKPFEAALDATDFDQEEGPLWRLRVLTGPAAGGSKEAETALLFAYNHAISDQASANTVVHELLSALASPSSSSQSPPQPFPPSIEEAVLAGRSPGLNTLRYAVREGILGALSCTILPHPSRRTLVGKGGGTWGLPAATRKTVCELRRLEPSVLASLASACRRRGLTVTAALSAAMLHVTSDFAHAKEEVSGGSMQLYRLLLSLNMRAFSVGKQRPDGAEAQQDWADGAVASAAGAMDYLARVPAGSGARLLRKSEAAHARFWEVAGGCRRSLDEFVAQGFVSESVALFDWGMRAIELNEVVEKEAENPATLGRAYTCGVSNMGIFGGAGAGAQAVAASVDGDGSVAYCPYRLTGLHYATSSSLTGTLYQLSCGTVGGALCLTLHYAWPLVDRATAGAFADELVRVLACVAEEG